MQRNYASESFCHYYDQSLFIGNDSRGNLNLAMCCWQKKQSVEQITFDDSYLEGIRNQAVNGFPTECSSFCKVPGHIANERERSRAGPWDNTGVKIKRLHLEQSLVCNLACISCSSMFSSGWNKHYQLFDPTAPTIRALKNPEQFWQHLDLSEVSELHFTGGEPLLSPDNKKILQHLRDIGRLSEVTLTYNTNGTILPDDELVGLWSRTKWVRLHVSLDGIGSTFEYTRYPAKWAEVEKNIAQFRTLKGPCILLEVNAIVGIHNIFGLPEFFDWWKTDCQTGNQGDPSQIFVRGIDASSYGGDVLSLRHFPNELLQDAKNMLQLLNDLPGAADLLTNLKFSESTKWIDYLERLDAIRNTNWRRDLPGPITMLNEKTNA